MCIFDHSPNLYIMKNLTFLFSFLLLITGLQAQEYLIVTTVESIVPAGIGRSRMIVQHSDINVDDFTTDRTDGKKSDQRNVKRSDAKVDNFGVAIICHQHIFWFDISMHYANSMNRSQTICYLFCKGKGLLFLNTLFSNG